MPEDTSPDAGATSQRLVAQIGPILHGHDPAVQSATLADLLAMWLAGHFVAGDPAETTRLRADLLDAHIRLVGDLIHLNEQIILERHRRGAH